MSSLAVLASTLLAEARLSPTLPTARRAYKAWGVSVSVGPCQSELGGAHQHVHVTMLDLDETGHEQGVLDLSEVLSALGCKDVKGAYLLTMAGSNLMHFNWRADSGMRCGGVA